ncbi:DUF2637 domain-containing protein [Rhodococcus sp. NPDC019627]|uniref:DUF2637 domain-containing protein n=1 Tax=unclassified Rhodococcus (in: high G+C Gram-positive bacteria) TaxID=192944 RepID=UPI003401A313
MKNLSRNIDSYATYGIAVLAFALSYSKLTDLALRAGYGEIMAHAWPLIVDGLAIVATRGVMRLLNSRWYAWTLLAASTSVSIVAAVANAMLPAGPLPPVAAAAVSVVPPLCLLVAPHLAVKLHREAQPAEIAPEEVAPEVADPEVAPQPDMAPNNMAAVSLIKVATGSATNIATKRKSNQEKRAEAVALGLTRNYKKREIARMVGASDTSVRRWLAEAGIAEEEPAQVAMNL